MTLENLKGSILGKTKSWKVWFIRNSVLLIYSKAEKIKTNFREKYYVHLNPSGSKPKIFYGLGKTHKTLKDMWTMISTFFENVENFKKYVNKKYKYVVFTCEIEQNGSFSFLDIKISRENNKFAESVYRKPTFSGVCTNFESFISKCYKRSFIDTWLYRGFSIFSNMEQFHLEISSPCILLTNGSESWRGASRHPAFMNGSLTVSQTRLPCPPCGKMGLQSWTVVMAMNKLSNWFLNQTW